ncbi:hypothetical protein [Pyrobaculum islandicum]|uniref:hypothetical protein n=1 Tax=Pyrobaculum islandicum TaxID=2277 RepID=UPI00069EDC84|nr:hypothetical protein [Pyrobaculum islandicum]
MEVPQGRYKIFRTKKYIIYYLLDDVEIRSSPEKKIVKGGHEFYYFGDVVLIKPIKEFSQARGVLSA